MLRIFTSVKIQRLWPGLNLQTWVPEASMLITRPPKLSIQGSPTDCGMSLCVIKKPRTRGGYSPLEGCKIQSHNGL